MTGPFWAQEAEPSDDVVAAVVRSMETGFEGDHMTGSWGGFRDRLVEHGVHFSAAYAGEVFGTASGGLKRGAVYEGLLELGLDVYPDQFSAWRGATLHISSLYPHGNSPTEELVGDISTISNIDAEDAWILFEWWVEQALFQDRVSLRLGQLAADEEFAISDYSALLLNAAFGWPTFFGANVPAPAFPLAAPGARLRVDPLEGLRLQAGIFDGNPDPGDSRGRPVNEHGTRLELNSEEGAFIVGEAAYAFELAGDDAPLPGTYKLGAWYHTGDFDHLARDGVGRLLNDPGSSGAPRPTDDNWGLYLVADQKVWHEPTLARDDALSGQGLSLWLRAATQPEDRNAIEHYVDGGLHYRGLLPGRDEDEAGLGVAWQYLSPELRDLARAGGETPTDYEVALEATYLWQVNSWWSLQPDVQYIIHPGGSTETPDALVLGLRSSFVF